MARPPLALRSGNVGPFFEADADGASLRWDAAIRKWRINPSVAITLVDQVFNLVNSGPTTVATFQIAAGSAYKLTCDLYASVGVDQTYKEHQTAVIGGVAAGNFTAGFQRDTGVALNWNVNAPSAGPGLGSVTVQVLGADSPRPTRVRVTLVPFILP